MGRSEVEVNFQMTLPHEREIYEICKLIMEVYEKPNYNIICITDSHEHMRYLINNMRNAVAWEGNIKIKLFREGIDVVDGGRLIFTSTSSPHTLRGVKADKVVLFGRIGELFYNLKIISPNLETVA